MKKSIYLVLDNIRSRENVGSIFRTSDAAGISKIYLCGITPIPPHSKISKSALGADNYVPWEYHKQTWRLLERLKKEKIYIVVLERFDPSTKFRTGKLTASKLGIKQGNIFKFKPKFPLALIVGNEVRGLSNRIMKYADNQVFIPMHGKKESLNVSVAFGICVYQIKN